MTHVIPISITDSSHKLQTLWSNQLLNSSTWLRNDHLKATMPDNPLLSLFFISVKGNSILPSCSSQTGQNLGIILEFSLSQPLSNPLTLIFKIYPESKLYCCYSSLAAFVLPSLLQKLFIGLPASGLSIGPTSQTTPRLQPIYELLEALQSAPPIILLHAVFSSHPGSWPVPDRPTPPTLKSLHLLCSPLGMLARHLHNSFPHLSGLNSSVTFSLSNSL